MDGVVAPARHAVRADQVRRSRHARAAAATVAIVVALALVACGDAASLLLGGQANLPEAITLTAEAAGTTSARLEWTSAGSGRAYQVERNGLAVARTADLALLDSRLAAGKRYCWRVFAYGGFGWTARSNEACIGTDAGTAEWRHEPLGAGRLPSVAVDIAANVHVCHFRAGEGIVHQRVAPSRPDQRVDADGEGQCAIAVDTAGVVHVAYLSRLGLRHATRDGAGWRSATVDAEALAAAQVTDGPALALDADGLPRIAYRRSTAGGGTTVVVATRRSAGWSFDFTGLAGQVGPQSLAIDSAGRSWLALIDLVGQSISIWRRDTAGWSRTYQQGLAPTRGLGAPIGIDASDRVATAWWRSTAIGAPPTVTHASGDSAGWRDEPVQRLAGVGYRVALAVGGDGEPVLAWADAGGDLRVAVRGDVGWTVEAVEGQRGAAEGLALAIAPDGEWRLVYDVPLAGTVALASRRP
jgi:hypothetical protein